MTDQTDWRRLLQWLDRTSAEEIDCDEFLAQSARLAEGLHAGHALAPDAASALQHLTVCPECEEEFEALRRAVQAQAETAPSDEHEQNSGGSR